MKHCSLLILVHIHAHSANIHMYIHTSDGVSRSCIVCRLPLLSVASDGSLRTTSDLLVYNDVMGRKIDDITITVSVQDQGASTLPCATGEVAQCGGFSPGMNTATVCINVTNTNTYIPECITPQYKCILEHNDPAGGFLYDVSSFNCTDNDGTFPSELLYTIEEGSVDYALFQIKDNSQLCLADGVLQTLDRESDDEYHVHVVVSDRGYPMGPPLTSGITVRNLYKIIHIYDI